MRTKLLLTIATVAVLAVTAGVSAQDGGRPFRIAMTGALEKPGPGDGDGTGTAIFRVNPGQGEICYELTVQNIEPAAAAHIHRIPPDPGPVVVPLVPPAGGSSSACAEVTRELAQAIIQNPTNYYVNVHTASFPAGAVRGNFERPATPLK